MNAEEMRRLRRGLHDAIRKYDAIIPTLPEGSDEKEMVVAAREDAKQMLERMRASNDE